MSGLRNAGNIESKCRTCTNRYPACHDSCEDYKEYKNKLENFKEKRAAIKNKDAQLDAHKRNAIAKELRKRGR